MTTYRFLLGGNVRRLIGCALLSLAGAVGSAHAADARTFNARDLVMLDRVSDPRISPDGNWLAYQLRETQYDDNKASSSLWLMPLTASSKGLTPARRLSAPAESSSTPRWSADGRTLYFISSRSGSSQVWKYDLAGGDAQPVTHAPLDVQGFMLSPDGRRLVVILDMLLDCDTPECTKQKLDERAARKATGQQFDKLFIRHWSTWSDGTRTQLFLYTLDAQGVATGAPRWVTRGIDGDVPSKPFGDDTEFTFTPDGRSLIFDARIAGRTEAWSTNFDLFEVDLDGASAPRNLTADNPALDYNPVMSPDGSTLAYLAQSRPGFESDRFRILLKDLATGSTHELLPNWDRSATTLAWSADGKTLYTEADDLGQKRLFAIDVAHAKLTALTDQGVVSDYSVGRHAIVYALESLRSPAQLFIRTPGAPARQLTDLNAQRLAGIHFGDTEQFSFKGWNDDTVYGYVVKPANYQPGHQYPVALLIHGGPEAAFGNEFHYRWNAQTYAGLGFAVVMIDFHGTPGYGQAFTDAIRNHWGDRPLEDLQKGWKYALSHYDFLNGANACALGASYGGYMVDWIAGNWSTPESGAWKCLVSHDGVFDARSMYYGTEEGWFTEWEFEGTPYDAPQNYERFNPIDHVADWKVPMLVVHSGQDFRIPLDQGIGVFTALQRRNIPSQFLYFPDENHWVLKPQNSVQWHDSVEAWIKRWTATP